MKTIKLIILAALCMLVPQGCTLAMRGHGKKNGRNVPKRVVPPRGAHHGGGGVVRRPVNEGVTVPSLDAFVDDFTPEEFELNFGHARGVNHPIQEVREVITSVAPVVDHQEQARAAERARSSAELFERVKNAGNSTSVDFKDLLDQGADINGYHNGLTPLLEAVQRGNPCVCESLIAHGADVNLPMNGDYSIGLVQQLDWLHQSNWRLLLQNHDQEAGNFPSLTALHIAAGLGNPSMVRLLIAAGANCNAITPDGCTPLYLTSALLESDSRASLIEIIKLLIEGGAHVNTVARVKIVGFSYYSKLSSNLTDFWLTPLLLVLQLNDVEMRDYLLAHGAHVNINNGKARTEDKFIPLIEASIADNVPVFRMFLGLGADARCHYSSNTS